MSNTPSNLAEQALDNLVNQFARPLDFLRELVQNSIDAGSPRIEVRIEYDPPTAERADGVARIHVDDWGEGMDRAVIDGKLTRLFESNKEGDLTKIGKFGIGFTSIFAIRPDAVTLETGKHGENSEVTFYEDRSFEVRSIDRPVDGTKLTLFKRMDRPTLDKFVEEARFILTYWCEHSNVPVTFWDRTQAVVAEVVDSDDPFAAFEANELPATTGPEPVNRPLSIDADLVVRMTSDDVEVVVGLGDDPLFGYYNGGLTLLRTRNTEALGRFEVQLQHLIFKVKNDSLEHTLTRDNVLHDKQWERVMGIVLQARDQLVSALLEQLGNTVTEGGDPSRWQRHLALLVEAERQATEHHSSATALEQAARVVKLAHDSTLPFFTSGTGGPLTLSAATASSGMLGIGPILLSSGDPALTRALQDLGIQLVSNTPDSIRLLRALQRPGLFQWFGGPPDLVPADEVFVTPQVLENAQLSPAERKLLKHTTELIHRAAGSSMDIRVGDFGGPRNGSTEALALNGPHDGKVFQRPGEGRWRWLKAFLLTRVLLINRHHPLFQASLLAASENPWLAAAGLATSLLHVEDIEGDKVHRLLMHLAHVRLDDPSGLAT